MLTSLKRIFRSGWLSFYRNSGLSIATVFIMVLTISQVSSLFLLGDATRFLVSSLEEKIDISVYFKETAPEEDILRIKEEMNKIQEVKNVEYVSRSEALDRFLERYKDNEVIIESLVEVGNPLSAALNIKAWQASQYEAVSNFLENSPNKDLIEKIDYRQRKAVIERIYSMTSGVKKIVISLSLLLGAVAILVAFNTIKLAIYSSRDEISMMRLVGASNWHIRGPFLIQGAISGIAATIATLLIFVVALSVAGPRLAVISPGFNVFNYFLNNFWLLFLVQFLTGIGLGMVSSAIAVRKYLKT